MHLPRLLGSGLRVVNFTAFSLELHGSSDVWDSTHDSVRVRREG